MISRHMAASLIGSIGLVLVSACGTVPHRNAASTQPHPDSLRRRSPHANPALPNPKLPNLTLPSGQVVTLETGAQWRDLTITLQAETLPPVPLSTGYFVIVGNHSTVLSHSIINTKLGPVMVVLNERTSPAAALVQSTRYEYWAILYGSQYAYAIDAEFRGNAATAKQNLLTLIKTWKV